MRPLLLGILVYLVVWFALPYMIFSATGTLGVGAAAVISAVALLAAWFTYRRLSRA